MTCLVCNIDNRTRFSTGSKLSATVSVDNGLRARLSAISKVTPKNGVTRGCKANISCVSSLDSTPNVTFGPKEELSHFVNLGIKASPVCSILGNARNKSESSLTNKVPVDKFVGKPNFYASSKLYPIGDISFKNKLYNTNIDVLNGQSNSINLYSNIDEGVFVGDYTENSKVGTLLSDDSQSLIFPSEVFQSGDLQYKFRVTYPFANPANSYLALRASASLDDYSARKPQGYKIYDVQLQDPSGNLIVQYEDIDVRGDNNFTTYLSQSKINKANQPTWNSDFPYMDSGNPLNLQSQPYSLTLNIGYICDQFPFDPKFDLGYERSCIISSGTPHPFRSLSISAIEIGNSGGVGVIKNNYLNFFSQVTNQPNLLSRNLLPTRLLVSSFDNGIYPQSTSLWTDSVVTNANDSNSYSLLNKIRTNSNNEFITLDYTNIQNSGRLILKFDTKPEPPSYDKYVGGSFSFGNDGFENADFVNYLADDNFFNIEKIELKITAKKSVGSVDYPIDVVGYSDDKILCVTSPVGGFLQNSGTYEYDRNNVVNASGFNSTAFSISNTAISDQSQYFNGDASYYGDHYVLSSAIVNSTSFTEYTVPLQITENPFSVGYNNYSSSSFFENLFLDIAPIPSGASISNVKLVVYYKPSNGLMMYGFGSPNNKVSGRKTLTLVPGSNVGGNRINTIVYPDTKFIGFSNPLDIKTNYARRWRGVDGNVVISGDFNPSIYDLSFNHKSANTPFLTSYIDFSNASGTGIYDHRNTYVGKSVINLNKLSTLGWRFSSSQLFDNSPTTAYTSISWSNQRRIYDSFDNVVRTSSGSQIELFSLNNTSLASGFALYFRYCPDKVSTNDFNNHTILSYENGSDWSMALVSENGNLKFNVKKSDNSIVTIIDTQALNLYALPVPILITYNNDNTKTFKLYTENDLLSGFTNLRASSASGIIPKSLSNSSLRIGYSGAYGGTIIPMFVTEIGCSNGYCNITQSSTNPSLKQTTAAEFFNSFRMQYASTNGNNVRSNLHSYIDDDISLWKLGDFKVCDFSPDFSFFTKSDGKDYLGFNLKHHGSGYSQVATLPLPSSVNLSGVAYHSQLESDFLRFNLSNIPSVDSGRFYAAAPRICKTLPKGYQFNDEAICVDTIVEHETYNDLLWSDGKVGPKLIVSLYSPTLNDPNRPSKDFGLISRSTHYLEPSGCIRKLTSKFTFNDLLDTSEPWASFDKEIYSQEFKERFFTKDIDSMFLQYDLVYPSGKPFTSNVKIHSANVRLDDAIIHLEENNNSLNMFNSGDAYQLKQLNLFSLFNSGTVSNSGFHLYVNGSVPSTSSLNVFINSSGYFVNPQTVNLYTASIGKTYESLGIYASGALRVEASLPLIASGFIHTNNNNLNIYTLGPNANEGSISEFVGLRVLASNSLVDYYPESSMSLSIAGEELASTNAFSILYVGGIGTIGYSNNDISLFTLNYPISSKLADNSASINWTNLNTGSNIMASDNSYAYVDSDDNIRGVDLVCQGNCSSIGACVEIPVEIHGIKWYDPPICVDGGIFRAKNTYTNLSYPSGSFRHTFESKQDSLITETGDFIIANNNDIITINIPSSSVYDPMPYSGHFYGIKKYTGLAPNLPYFVTITGRTGSEKPIDIPTEIVEIEYNKYESDDPNVDYNGLKVLPPNYNQNDYFGKSVASKENVLAVGSPFRSLPYENGSLQNAGAVFLYKRNDRPEGYEWPLNNYKSDWSLDQVITLPSGLIKDYSISSQIEVPGLPFLATQTKWFVGQEGRQFGHSIDLSINKENSKQILVVGGPSAKWTPREFDNSTPSGVGIGLMIFTDEFEPVIPAPTFGNPFRVITYQNVLDAINGKDLVFNYFSNPRVKFDTKLIICQPIADSTDIVSPPFPDKPDFITLKSISRNYGYGNDPNKTSKIVNDMKSAFFEAFPNSIPPILGLYVDNSNSLGREALEPAIDQFIDFYKSYSFSGGLVDSFGVRSSGQVIEYTPDSYDAENWIEMSKTILSEVLDTGNLVNNDQMRFISNTVGTFNSNLGDFNLPPESGGKVYVFEKESGHWNLIQEINSPNVTYSTPDRFGHSVSISDNGEVIAIGSPYINQAVTILERKDVKKSYYQQLQSWVDNNRPDKYGSYESSDELYLALDATDKFLSRKELNIEEYQTVHTFDYSNMQPQGNWSFIPNAVAPTSRLGYSVDVNEDGSVVVASAPTDSLNPYNDADVYYNFNNTYTGKLYRTGYNNPNSSGVPTGTVNSTWSSSVNAGSIHVFESRKYYPHNTVIEYGRFGNLHEMISDNTPDSGHFGYLSQIFEDKNFTKTEFSDSEIPTEAGLAFIITPAVDAITNSDEVFDNISNWLALGDRNLVLVANDPIWEAGGKYQKSNEILNTLLSKLNSRMRIVPARTSYESLSTGYNDFNNILPSFIPQGSTPTYVQRLQLRGSGVADVKMYFGYTDQMSCAEVTDCSPDPVKVQIQTKCEMPLRNYGDLRAKWNESCCTNGGILIYERNWPLVFGSYAPECGDTSFSPNPLKNFEPVPLLAAAEKVQNTVVYPAVPAQFKAFPKYDTIDLGQTYYEFGSPIDDDASFVYNSGNQASLNITNTLSSELFYRLSEGILQARAIPKIDITPYIDKQLVSDTTNYIVEQKYNDSSSVIVIAGNATESEDVLYSGAGDQNVKLYVNLVSKTSSQKGYSDIAKLYGEFKSSNPKSILKTVFTQNGNYVTENLNPNQLNSTYNVAWIAGISSQPSNEDVEFITNWLSLGNKKLVITCDNVSDDASVRLASSLHAQELCERLNLNIKVVKLPILDTYIEKSVGTVSINQDHQAGGSLFLKPNRILSFQNLSQFYPLSAGDSVISVAYNSEKIYDDVVRENVNRYWDTNAGIARITIPTIQGSGYKLFFTALSDNLSQIIPLDVFVDNATVAPSLSPDIGSLSIFELDKDGVQFISKELSTSVPNIRLQGSETKSVNIQANSDSVNVYISSAIPRAAEQSAFIPTTMKLVGVSGVNIPIHEKIALSSIQVQNGQFDYVKISDEQPEYSETIEVVRSISTDNSKYCANGCEFLGNQLIEDGPVIAAQEIEIMSPFNAGVARSRITVITDSSILQGRFVADEDGSIPQETYAFIRSLYPNTEFPSTIMGRQFNVYNKIVSPERGSPSKYFQKAQLSGINNRFGGSGTLTAPLNQYEANYLPQYISRPDVPWKDETDEDRINEIKNHFISGFLSSQINHASTAKFSGIIDGTMYTDASVAGGLPQLVKDKGYDYLELPSGYLGDLFGYAVCVRGNKIVVGSPFSGFDTETITPWNSGINLFLGNDGGAGAAYMFEKSGELSWSCVRKFRPDSLMGQVSGVNSDQFGRSIDMQYDTLVIGSPNHDYANFYNIEYSDGAFAKKNFNPQFDTPHRTISDGGLLNTRDEVEDLFYNNFGAIYLYENKIVDWENKKQSWKLIEKSVANPPASGVKYGQNVCLSRPRRSDADYSIFGGSTQSGCVYIQDIMLRKQSPSLRNNNAWIDAKVFGDGDGVVNLRFSNSGNYYYGSGNILPNSKGEIFLEVSGQDPSTKGFIAHHPYIESVLGYYQYGKLLDGGMNLYTSGMPLSPTAQLPLILDAEKSSYVYSSVGMFNDGVIGVASNSGLNLFNYTESGVVVGSSGLTLVTSGTWNSSESLNLRIRGK